MAGGSGTRLWPISRDTMPKQFVALLGSELSTFQTALRRVAGPEFERPIVVTSNEFRFLVGDQLSAISIEADIVLEPMRRDSAAAIAVGTTLALQRDSEAICIVLPADHVIENEAAFVADCMTASELASRGWIMTLGIRPTSPSSAYGYIQPAPKEIGEKAHQIARFVEKPDTKTAQSYIKDGYLWNSGNFLFSAQRMREELDTYAPDILTAAENSVAKGKRDLDFLRLDHNEFEKSPSISIDYAVMEKSKKGGVIAATFDWSDVGSWDALHDILPQDEAGNVFKGPVAAMDTRGSYVRSDAMLTAVFGLENVVVVTTHDAVLVASKDAVSDVKRLVTELKVTGHPEATEHLRIHRPWGWYQRIDIGERFQVKHITVKPGGKLSLQRHFHRAEHWVVVQGTAEVTIDDQVKYYHENEAAYLPLGCVHRMHNPGKIELKIIEVQVGSYTGEDDIVRIEDVYARS